MSIDAIQTATALRAFAALLRERHLAAVAAENLRVSRALGVPLLRLFESLSDAELGLMYRESTATFLSDLDQRAHELSGPA